MAYSPKEKQDIIDRICKHISENNASLRSALMLHDMPDATTFYIWINEDESKSKQYARACEQRAENIFEEILEIADENALDITMDDEGGYNVNGEIVQRSRLKIDARKWMLSKMQPKKYGDKLDVTSDNKPINTTMQIEVVKPKDED